MGIGAMSMSLVPYMPCPEDMRRRVRRGLRELHSLAHLQVWGRIGGPRLDALCTAG